MKLKTMTRRKLAFLCLTLCLCTLNKSSIRAAQPAHTKPAIPENELVIADDDNLKYSPAAAYNPQHEEFMVVWENVWPGGVHDIYGRRVGIHGELSSIYVISTGDYNRLQPSIAYDYNYDRYLVTWSYDYFGDGSDMDIYGRYIPWDGPSGVFTEFGIDGGTYSSSKPQMAWGMSSSEYLVVYKNDLAGYASWIDGVFIHSDLTFQHVEISNGAEDRDYPDVAYNLARNEFLVVWDVIKAGTGLDVYGKRYNASGAVLLPGEFAIAQSTLIEQHPSVAACDKADQYLVVWDQQRGTTSDYDIWGRYMTGDINLSPLKYIEGTTSLNQFPDVTCNWPGRQYFLAWHDQYASPPLRFGIWAKWLNTDQSMWPAFEIVAPSATRDRLFPAVSGGRNTYLAVWEHQRDGTSYQDIHGMLYQVQENFLPLVVRN